MIDNIIDMALAAWERALMRSKPEKRNAIILTTDGEFIMGAMTQAEIDALRERGVTMAWGIW